MDWPLASPSSLVHTEEAHDVANLGEARRAARTDGGGQTVEGGWAGGVT